MNLRTGLIVFLGLLALGALTLWLVPAAPPPPPPPVAVPAPPPAEAPPPSVEPTPPAAPETSALPQLPEVKVAGRPIHAVPEDTSPPPSPQPLDLRGAGRPPAGQSDEVRLGAHAPAPPPTPRQFSGKAVATGAVELQVDKTAVSLFGIKRAGDRDRCGAEAGSDCAAAARQALASRLGVGGTVSCRIPNPHPGLAAIALCLDAEGVDLSGFLIAQGLALADTGQSYDYVGAESIARNLKRGLWQFR